jgi:thioredoxin reductase (NADPH)
MSGQSFVITPVKEDQGTEEEAQPDRIYDLIVLGAGPAGLTAAIYTGRADIDTLVLGGHLPGGQPSNTDVVENFPGFPEGIDGPELAQRFQAQAERFGAKIVFNEVVGVDFSSKPFKVRTHEESYQGRSIIIATGAVPRKLGVPGEDKFYGRGVSTCATCDGFFYRDKKVVVVGGGDSAIVEGLFLTKFAREVVVIHRRDELRAAKINRERAFANPKMRFMWDTVVEEILGDKSVTGVRVRNVETGETSVVETDGVFTYIGMDPGTEMFEGELELDRKGYIVADEQQRTSRPGVFVAGDVQDPYYRQLVVAAGSGAVAAMEAERFLEKQTETA